MSLTRIAVSALCLAPAALGAVRLTEWEYNGNDGEFVEWTNLGPTAVDFTGWSYDDDSRTPGAVSLSAFGVVAVGESVILCEPTAATFRANWALSATVKIIGGNATNLGRSDEINLYDQGGVLVDRLTYSDVNFPGTIRTQNISGWTPFANLGANNVAGWVLSTVGDAQGSYIGVNGDVANPGSYIVPTPGTAALLTLAGLVTARRRSRAV